jgi:ubiquinone/menaquinone biosynthesis C-methylase UbiE
MVNSQYLDWNVREDAENIRETAILLRAKNAEHMYMRLFKKQERVDNFLDLPRVQWRSKTLEKLEILTGKPISGQVMEIGAGTGWCSAVISQRPTVEKVFTLEYDPYCVESLIPIVHTALKANQEKIVRVLGSYNKMKCGDSEFDYIISIGAIHHSENLKATLAECYRVLKPGGYMLATEPCEYNSFTIEEQLKKENEIVPTKTLKVQYGEDLGTITKKDNSDHFYRLCEYEATGLSVGFNVLSFVFDDSTNSGGKLGLWRRKVKSWFEKDGMFKHPAPYQGFQRQIAYPYFAKDAYKTKKPLYDRLMLVLQKPVLSEE